MALGTTEKYWGGSVVTDDYGRLIAISEGDEVGALAEGEKYWAGSHATDDHGRLIVVGPGGEPISSKEELETHGVGVAKYDSTAETWEARPTGFARVVFVSAVHGAPDPSDAEEFDEKKEPPA